MMGREEMVALAERVIADLPAPIAKALDGVAIRVEEWAEPHQLASVRLQHPQQLLGLYAGTPLPYHTTHMQPASVNTVYLFRGAILAYAAQTGWPLARVIEHVLIHEIGHHFGYSDADMERIERET